MAEVNRERLEALGPAEHTLQTLTRVVDHAVHNRPGMIVKDEGELAGVKWQPITWKLDGETGRKVVYSINRVGKRTVRTEIGILRDDGRIFDPTNRRKVGDYRKPGLFPEVVAYLYRQVAAIWQLDNEFSARLASWAYDQDDRDLKVILAAFMLVQSKNGEPVFENGTVAFYDDDYRDVGEAMCLHRRTDKKDFNPKLLLRVAEVLELPEIADINRELGFGISGRNPAMGRYRKAVTKWLRQRERNLPMLEGLVKAGFRTAVMQLARKVGYKPETEKFFELLRWKQKQSTGGHRMMAIGKEVVAADSWANLTEREICERITDEKPGYKYIAGHLPKEIGLTRAILAASIEAGCLSEKDLIIMTPTIEELGLLKVKSVERRWKAAVGRAEDQRAMNIAKRVKNEKVAEVLQDGSDAAAKKALEKATRDLRIYFIVDISGSMSRAIASAKQYIKQMLPGFPQDRLHVSVFNTFGQEVVFPAYSAAGVEHAFSRYSAGGGTCYAMGVRALAHNKPKDDEDVLFIFVGDEGDRSDISMTREINQHGLRPSAFGLLKLVGDAGDIVTRTAQELGIPCFMIEEAMFADPYSLTRTLQRQIASTPVNAVPQLQRAARKSLVQTILETELLQKPVWASAA